MLAAVEEIPIAALAGRPSTKISNTKSSKRYASKKQSFRQSIETLRSHFTPSSVHLSFQIKSFVF